MWYKPWWTKLNDHSREKAIIRNLLEEELPLHLPVQQDPQPVTPELPPTEVVSNKPNFCIHVISLTLNSFTTFFKPTIYVNCFSTKWINGGNDYTKPALWQILIAGGNYPVGQYFQCDDGVFRHIDTITVSKTQVVLYWNTASGREQRSISSDKWTVGFSSGFNWGPGPSAVPQFEETDLQP